MVLALDTSASVGSNNWETLRQFALDLIPTLDVGPDANRVSVSRPDTNWVHVSRRQQGLSPTTPTGFVVHDASRVHARLVASFPCG